MSTDTLSEVLRAVRLTGAVFFSVDASAPWVAETRRRRARSARTSCRASSTSSSTTWSPPARAGAGSWERSPVRLEAGDVIVFPQGDAHVMSSAPGMRGDPGDFAARRARTEQPSHRHQHAGGGAERDEPDLRLPRLRRAPVQPAAVRPPACHPRPRAVGRRRHRPLRRARPRGVDGPAPRQRACSRG